MDLGQTLPPLVIMGVSGTGKTVVGRQVAEALGVAFIDGDDLHTPENKAKMAAGIPLTDADRMPWLAAIATELSRRPAPLIACSALRRRYRDRLRIDAPSTFFIHLDGPRAVIADHLARRAHEFMSPTLLDSQLATLEALTPDEAGRMERIGEAISGLERRAMEAERDTVDRYVAAYLSQHVGEVLSARITGVQGFGFFATVEGIGGDGLVPVRDLGREYFRHDETRHALVGEETGEAFTLGQRLELRLVEANPVSGALRFELPDGKGAGSGSSTKERRGPSRVLKRRGRPGNIRHQGRQ